MSEPGVTRVPVATCLECHHQINAIGDADPRDPERRAPLPGDPVVCIRCGAVQTVDAAMRLRPFTEAEIAELQMDADAMRDIARAVGRVHWIRAAAN